MTSSTTAPGATSTETVPTAQGVGEQAQSQGSVKQKKRCFVIMGFGIKTDLATGRKLNLDNAYRNMIKPAVVQCGLECVRADEIPHSGVIDLQMYRELLTADVVIADISTVNPNAIYELGIRHALRPWTTVVISEAELKYPFDLGHIVITPYTHLGDDIGVGEARRFIEQVSDNLREILEHPVPDSPVYTFLADLAPPTLKEQQRQVVASAVQAINQAIDASPSASDSTLSVLIEQGEIAIRRSDFPGAKEQFRAAVSLCALQQSQRVGGVRHEPYLVQRLALTTYKAGQPDPVSALKEALQLLAPLSPEESNDPETVGLGGAIHKHLYEQGQGVDHLQTAIWYYSRGYYLRSDLYNGINLAALMTLRAASPLDPTDQEKVADLVGANRIRAEVLDLCQQELIKIAARLESAVDHESREYQVRQDAERRFWCIASMAGAYYGLGKWPDFEKLRKAALDLKPPEWMVATFEKHLAILRGPLETHGHLLNPPWQANPAG